VTGGFDRGGGRGTVAGDSRLGALLGADCGAGRIRVIDLGVRSPRAAVELSALGHPAYLGFCEANALAGCRAEAGDLAARLVEFTSTRVAAACSAELLLIRREHAALFWAVSDLRDLRFIAIERVSGAGGAVGRLAVAAARLRGAARRLGRFSLGGSDFELFERPGCDPPRARTYFSPAWGPAGLAERLNAAGLRYALLRWFEGLPHIEPGEDLDLLVADADAETLRGLVESEPGTQPIDLYSVSGLPASDYQDSAYYPPGLARSLLERAVQHRSGFLVPEAMDHLHSLAYHAVYHKGERAGLRSEVLGPGVAGPEHDYPAILAGLAKERGVDLPISYEGLDKYLSSVGWRPPTDTIRRLSAENPWAGRLIADGDQPGAVLPGGAELAVFLVRERAVEVLGRNRILGVFDRFGFDVFHDEALPAAARNTAEQTLRGGNWGTGPFPTSGGAPSMLVVAVHHAPSQPYHWMAGRYPHLTNAETYEVKLALRGLVEDLVEAPQWFNPVHSADNSTEAREYLRTVVPSLAADLESEAVGRAGALTAPSGMLRNLSLGRRSRVDVVVAGGEHRVRKTFVPAFLRFRDREVDALRKLAGSVPALPELLATGPNWFELPLYRDTLSHSAGHRLPMSVLRQMVAVLRQLYEAGYDVVDAKPANFLLDPELGLKLVDLEFLYPYDGDRPAFAASANFGEPWPGFAGDRPVGDLSYESRWLPATGVPLSVLLEGGAAATGWHRAISALRSATVAPGSSPRRVLRGAKSSADRLRAGARAAWQDFVRDQAGL